jgi:hypothetical protein
MTRFWINGVVGLCTLFACANLCKAEEFFLPAMEGPAANGEKCHRFTYDEVFNTRDGSFLSVDEQRRLAAGELISKLGVGKDGYSLSYVFQISSFDPELIMGVFASSDEHAGNPDFRLNRSTMMRIHPNGLGDFVVRSEYVGDKNTNPFRVFYEQQVDFLSNGEYVIENKLETADGGYILNSKLVSSTDAKFSPQWLDAYVSVVGRGRSTLSVACNHIVPRSSMFQGKFNGIADERLVKSAQNLLKWVTYADKGQGRAEDYRGRVKKLLGR